MRIELKHIGLIRIYWLSFFIFFSVTILINFFFIMPAQNKLNAEEEIEHSKAVLATSFEFIQPALASRDLNFLRNYVSNFSSYPGIDKVFIIDPEGLIIASSDIAIEESNYHELDDASVLRIGNFLTSKLMVSEFNDESKGFLEIMVKINFPVKNNSLRDFETGALVFSQDINPLIKQNKELFSDYTFVGAVVGLVIILLLQLLIVKPFASRLGNLTAKIKHFDIDGTDSFNTEDATDEIGQLSNTFKNLLDQIKQRTSALNTKNAILKAQSEVSPAGIVVTTTKNNSPMIEWNKRFEDMWNIPESVMISGDSEQAIASVLDQVEDPASFSERIWYLHEHPDVAVWAEEVRLKNHRVFERYSTGILNEDGEYDGRVWFYFDVTQRILEKDRFSVLFKNAAHSNIVSDETGRIELANNATEKVFGYENSELLGVHIDQLLKYPDKENSSEYPLLDSLKGGVDNPNYETGFELIAIKKDSSEFSVQVTPSQMTAEGKDKYIFCIQDLTKIKMLEKQILQSQKMEAIGRITGGIAHDFNNILAILSGNIELLKLDCENKPELVDRLSNAMDNIVRGTHLTRRLLDFSRQESNSVEKTNVAECITEIHSLVKQKEKEQIKVKLDLRDNLWAVCVNKPELENAILNLFNNACDALEKGGNVFVSAENKSFVEGEFVESVPIKSGDYVRISVTDTGCGIEKESLSKIFEPFYTTKERGKGTGLGLCSVFSFTQRFHGVVTVTSKLGDGTSISMFLPRYSGGETNAKTALESESSIELSNYKILVVDDDKDVCKVTCDILRSNGIHIKAAHTGEEALTEIQKDRFDAVISDVVMPDVNGYALAQSILKEYPECPIILISGYADFPGIKDNVDPLICQQLDNVILNKPFTSSELIRHIKRTLELKVVKA